MTDAGKRARSSRQRRHEDWRHILDGRSKWTQSLLATEKNFQNYVSACRARKGPVIVFDSRKKWMQSRSATGKNFQNFVRACTAMKGADIERLKGKLKKLKAKLREQHAYICELEDAVASQQQREEKRRRPKTPQQSMTKKLARDFLPPS